MESRSPGLDGPIPDTASNQHHKDYSGRYSDIPEVGIRVPDALKVLEVHTEVTTEEGQWCEEDGYEGDDGHVCVGAGTCRQRSVMNFVTRHYRCLKEDLPIVLNMRDDKLFADASICSSD